MLLFEEKEKCQLQYLIHLSNWAPMDIITFHDVLLSCYSRFQNATERIKCKSAGVCWGVGTKMTLLIFKAHERGVCTITGAGTQFEVEEQKELQTQGDEE